MIRDAGSLSKSQRYGVANLCQDDMAIVSTRVPKKMAYTRRKRDTQRGRHIHMNRHETVNKHACMYVCMYVCTHASV